MKIAIYGYGNLGRGVEVATLYNEDIELFGVFSRRDPSTVKTSLPTTKVYSADDVLLYRNEIDVLIICGGSATDLPVMTPSLARSFCVVDSFDTHARIPEHFSAVDSAAKDGGNLALISGMLLENRSKMPRVTIENCTVKRCPHIRLSAPISTVKDNYFDLSAENLYVYDLIDFWGECGAVEEMLIENNSFGALAERSITIGSCRPESSNHLHDKIIIKNNRFAKPEKEAIVASHVQNLVLDNNTFGAKL
jgi:hypothetical protein